MPAVLIWVASIPVAAFFAWAVLKWPAMPLRIAAAALFAIVWVGGVWFASMDLPWRIAMPVVAVTLMAFILVKRTRFNGSSAI